MRTFYTFIKVDDLWNTRKHVSKSTHPPLLHQSYLFEPY